MHCSAAAFTAISFAFLSCYLPTVSPTCDLGRTGLPAAYVVDLGDPVTLTSGCPCDPGQQVTWYHTLYEHDSPQGGAVQVQADSGQSNCDLSIESSEKLHNGTYYFTVQSSINGNSQTSDTIYLDVHWSVGASEVVLFSPELTSDSNRVTVTSGSAMTLTCRFDRNPRWPSFVTWLLNGSPIQPSADTHMTEDVLRIEAVTEANGGSYICRVKGIMQEKSLHVTVVDSVENGMSATAGDCSQTVEEGRQFWVHFTDRTSNVRLNSNTIVSANTPGFHIFPNGSVHVGSASRDMRTLSRFGTTPEHCHIDVQYLDPPTLTPSQIIVGNGIYAVAGDDNTVVCSAGDSNPPISRKLWMSDGNIISSDPSGTVSVIDLNSDDVIGLRIAGTPTGEAGFDCMMSNGVRTLSVHLPVVHLTYNPEPPPTPHLQVLEDQPVRMQCLTNDSDLDQFDISWSRQGQEKPLLRAHTDGVDNNILMIERANPRDAFVYSCVATHRTIASFQMSNSIALKVIKILKFVEPAVRPSSVLDHYLEGGSNASIPCVASAEGGPPTVKWEALQATGSEGGGQVIPLPAGVSVLNTTLRVTNASERHQFSYRCTAWAVRADGVREEIHVTFNVRVAVGVNLVEKVIPENQTCQMGSSVTLHCAATGQPPPDTVWFYDSFDGKRHHQRVPPTDLLTQGGNDSLPRFLVSEGGTRLEISEVREEDEGYYYCIFNNTAHFGKPNIRPGHRAYLVVQMRPAGQQSDRHPWYKAGALDKSVQTISIAVACATGYILFMLLLTIYCRRRRRNKSRASLAVNEDGVKGEVAGDVTRMHGLLHNNAGGDADLQVPLIQKRALAVEKLQFPRHELQTVSLLGRGDFGDVFLAETNQGLIEMNSNSSQSSSQQDAKTTVMVKSLLQKDKLLHEKFNAEMKMYSQLRHPNIVRLLGCCTEAEPLYMILENPSWGDLKSFLTSQSSESSLELVHKLTIAHQALLALQHLAKLNFVHRDVAARNFLIEGPNIKVKLSSVSLCKDVYRSEYFLYRSALIPLRWMPLEAIYDGNFTEKSDSYSFGVTLWEVFSLGAMPFAHLSDDQVLKNLTIGQMTLDVGGIPGVPLQIEDIIKKCLDENAFNRPSFTETLAILQTVKCDSQV